ncbi:MAG: response regulator [Phycisphaeraceae bacterium]|nr:response regulator [Phycisphaeraceae bacterium]
MTPGLQGSPEHALPRTNATPRGSVRKDRTSRILQGALLCGAGAFLMTGLWIATRPISQNEIERSASSTMLMELGSDVRAGIARVVAPAMERTKRLAASPDVIDALRTKDAARQTAACNHAIRAATEIDAIALFNARGNIVAINTTYASGEPIAPERVARVMDMNFADRQIVQQCVKNDADRQVLEFQTSCDITPALFDSPGLSVAYSVPVRDTASGERLGVASSRLRFERLTELVARSAIDGVNCSLELVTDRGTYFSEDISSGRALPPVPPDALAAIVAPLVSDTVDYAFTKYGEDYVVVFRLRDFATLEGGGIQVLLRASQGWLAREARQERALHGGLLMAAGLGLLLVVYLLRTLAASRKNEQRARSERAVATIALAELSAHKAALDQHAIVSILDATGRITDVNAACVRLSGQSREEQVGRSLRDLVTECHDEQFWEALWRTVSAGAVWQGAICRKTANQGLCWMQSTIVPFRGPDDRTTQILCIGADITERIRSEADRERANRAEAASQAKSEFLANMSHEIRTPLNGVIGLLDLLLGTELDREQRRYGRLARSSATLLTSVLGDILDLSKIEAGRLELSPCDFNLHEAVEEVMALMGSTAEKKGLEIACYIAPDVPLVVHADPERLRQVIVNLVNNAIKFTERGSVVVRVTMDSEGAADPLIRFTVTDTGVGVPQDRMDRLFKAFSQADASTTRVYGGTGLGLAISKQLVALMGGQIGVESEPGRGSTFWFTMLATLPHRPQATGCASMYDPASIRVLAVDDNPVQREILCTQIAAWGMQASTASGGEEAIEILRLASDRAEPYTLAVIDSDMPGMDGCDLALGIRANRQHSNLSLILMLPADDDIETARLHSMGFAGKICKPVRPSALFDAIMNSIASSDGTVEHPHMPLCVPQRSVGESEPVCCGPLRILVAEDNEVNQIVVHEVLTKAGHVCDVAGDGKSAVEAVLSARYDLVLMDCQMPGMDGFEATRQIRQREAVDASLGHLPIIALTANAMKGDRESCLSVGMDGYASKPINPRELLRTIRAVLDATTARRNAA